MNRRSFVGILVATASLVGCAPPWHVVVQSVPDPFTGQRRFGVLPIDYAGLMVGEKPEPVFLAEKDAGQRASFMEDKAALNARFLEALREEGHAAGIEFVPATGPGDAPFVVRPSIAFLEPGFYAAIASQPSLVRMTLRLTGPDGRVFDEISLIHATPWSVFNPSSGGRLREDGGALGQIVARYVQARVAGGG